MAITAKEANDLATLALVEGKREGTQGQAAIMHTALNRAQMTGEPLSKVIYDTWQYTGMNPNNWTDKKGRTFTTPRTSVVASDVNKTSRAYQDALNLAYEVGSGLYADPTGGATHYFNPDVVSAPDWATPNAFGGTIGHHAFYRRNDIPNKRSQWPSVNMPSGYGALWEDVSQELVLQDISDLQSLGITNPYDAAYMNTDAQTAYPETITNDIADVLAFDDGLQYFDSLPRSKPTSPGSVSILDALDALDGFNTAQDVPVYNQPESPSQAISAIDGLFSMTGTNSLPATPVGQIDAFALDDLPSIGGGADYGLGASGSGAASVSLPDLSLDSFDSSVAPGFSLRGNNDFWAAEDRDQQARMDDQERNDTLASALSTLEDAGLMDSLSTINSAPDISKTLDAGIGSSASGTATASLGGDSNIQNRIDDGFNVFAETANPYGYQNKARTYNLPDILDTLPQSKPIAPIDLVGDIQPFTPGLVTGTPPAQPVTAYTMPDVLDTLPQSKPQPSTLATKKAAKKMTGLATTTLGGVLAGPLGALGGYALGKVIDDPVSNRVGDFVSGGYVGPSGMTYGNNTGISRGLSKVENTGNWGDFWDSNSQNDQVAQMAWDREKAASEGRQLRSLFDAFSEDLGNAFSGGSKGKTVTGRQANTAGSGGGSSDRSLSGSSGESSGGGLLSSLFGGSDDNEDSGGGTIICSELYRQGYLSKELWQADETWGRMTARRDPDIIRGYRHWAAPVVRLMKRSPRATRIIATLTAPWARQMAYEAGYLPNGNFLGWLTNLIGIPFSRLVGKGLKLSRKWQRAWQT